MCLLNLIWSQVKVSVVLSSHGAMYSCQFSLALTFSMMTRDMWPFLK